MGGKLQLLTPEERSTFDEIFETETVNFEKYPEMKVTSEWFSHVMKLNAKNGKQMRGTLTVAAHNHFSKGSSTKERDFRLACILGWCLEILQAGALVADDIMDGSKTRRGVPCWYTKPDVGLSATNDAIYLLFILYSIIDKHFTCSTLHNRLTSLFHDITLKVIYGQSLDTRLPLSPGQLDSYTMETYEQIVKYKTSCYSFYLPIKLAMTINDGQMENKAAQKELNDISIKMGLLFQIQDDYLDVYGDSKITGKVGTDIIDGKCSWLIVKSLEICSDDQRQCIVKNYGRNDPKCVEEINKLFDKLKLQSIYKNVEKEIHDDLQTSICHLQELPKELLKELLTGLYSREK